MVEFRILGSLEAESCGVRVSLGGPRERAVLAAIVLGAGRVVPVRQLIDVVWDDDPPATAGKQLRNAVSRLRHALGRAGAADVIVTAPGGYRLEVDRCAVDARAFEAGVAAAEGAAGGGRLGEAAGLLGGALALWRGPALAGLAGRVMESAAWAWEERRLAALELRYGHELALGRHREVLGELAGLAASDPLREKLVGQYMLALYRCGRQADALATYHATRELLADQMGLDPGPELRGLQQQILTADPVLAPPSAAPVAAERAEGTSSAEGPAVPQVRYSLPTDTAAFTGRDGELEVISAAVADAAGTGGVVGIHAIGGMPGVGKTALAVHAAHRLREEFPDRQLFVDLHGHTPGQEPVRPEEALAGLLAAAGVDARSLPADLAGRAGLWRDRMAGQRVVLVLDNAASSAQVTPLLPGSAGCLVLVTSRRHLGDLPGAVAAIPVDVLAPDQGREMFTRLAPRATAAPAGAVDEVVRLAEGLPLAICLLARVYARHPSWTLADLAAETDAGVLTLAAEEASVAAAFEVSYRYLAPARQRFFRRLGLHPGATIDAYAAAALADVPLAGAAGLLDGLHGEGLLTEVSYRRYGMHDLIRSYAQDLAAADPPASRDEAVGRLLDYYQHTAATAQALLARQTRTSPLTLTAIAVPTAVPPLTDCGRALAWARAERGNLLACLDHATRAGQHDRVVALTAGLAGLLRQDGPWAEAITRHGTAVQAARRLGDRLGEAGALSDLGVVRRLTGDYPGAAGALGEALGIFRDLGHRMGQAGALGELGVMRRLTGDYPGATRALEEALGIFRDLGDRGGEAEALNEAGTLHRVCGDLDQARTCHQQALHLARHIGSSRDEACALAGLGRCALAAGHTASAQASLRQAQEIFRSIGAAEESDVTTELSALTKAKPPAPAMPSKPH